MCTSVHCISHINLSALLSFASRSARAKSSAARHIFDRCSRHSWDYHLSSFCVLCVQTFEEADLAGDEIISLEEWHTLVINSPDIIGYMTLPVLNQAGHLPASTACVLLLNHD